MLTEQIEHACGLTGQIFCIAESLTAAFICTAGIDMNLRHTAFCGPEPEVCFKHQCAPRDVVGAGDNRRAGDLRLLPIENAGGKPRIFCGRE